MTRHFSSKRTVKVLLILTILLGACQNRQSENQQANAEKQDSTATQRTDSVVPKPISEPLIREMYTADPSAHVFEGEIYIYPSHDIDAGIAEDDEGGHFAMRDYHVL